MEAMMSTFFMKAGNRLNRSGGRESGLAADGLHGSSVGDPASPLV